MTPRIPLSTSLRFDRGFGFGSLNPSRNSPLRSKKRISASVGASVGAPSSPSAPPSAPSPCSRSVSVSASRSGRLGSGTHAAAISAPRGCHASGGWYPLPSLARGKSPASTSVTARSSPSAIRLGSTLSAVAWNSRSSLPQTLRVGSAPRGATSVAMNCPSPRQEMFATPSPPPPPTGASARTWNSFVMEMSVPAHVHSVSVSPSGHHAIARRPCATRPTHSGTRSGVRMSSLGSNEGSTRRGSSGSGATRMSSPVNTATQTPRSSGTYSIPTIGARAGSAGAYGSGRAVASIAAMSSPSEAASRLGSSTAIKPEAFLAEDDSSSESESARAALCTLRAESV